MTNFSAPKGTHDILSDQFYARKHVSKTILQVLERYGYQQLLTPAFENIEVLKAKAGEAILDQIYEFRDKGDRHLGLRSDITASVGRLIAAGISSLPKPVKSSCYDRVWRYESPQSGRYREFFQINAEMFGASDPISDAELIACFCDCYDTVGLTDYKIHIGHRPLLENFVKTLNVKEVDLLAVVRVIDKAPKITEEEFEKEAIEAGLPHEALPDLKTFTSLSGPLDEIITQAKNLYYSIDLLRSNLDELDSIIQFLKLYKVESKCIIDLAIARGSDYYTGFIFECVYNTELVGSIGGGGRYDDLIKVYGGPSTPATGFSIGFERVITLLNELDKIDASSFIPGIDYYVAVVDDSCLSVAIEITQNLRKKGSNAEIDLRRRKLGSQLSQAAKLEATWTIIVGPEELSQDQVVLRNMETREEKAVYINDFII